jgi:hypothetical protein
LDPGATKNGAGREVSMTLEVEELIRADLSRFPALGGQCRTPIIVIVVPGGGLEPPRPVKVCGFYTCGARGSGVMAA